MTTELRGAIDDLYAAFAGYAGLPPPPYEGMHDQTGWADVLGSKPLRQLTPVDLERFARKAMTTWGDADDFRHYLPRLFKLAADPDVQSLGVAVRGGYGLGNGIGDTEVEVLFDKLDYGQWRTWPAAEQAAVAAYLRSLWRDVCRNHPHPFRIDSCLCAIARTADDLSPYLNDWRPDRSRGEAMQFADFFCDPSRWRESKVWRRLRWGLGHAWWDDCPVAREQVTSWALSPDRLAELERAFFAFGTDDETAAALSTAADQFRYVGRFEPVGPTPPAMRA